MQTWKIKGQVYTHAQILEMKRQGLNPHKDNIVMKFITNPALRDEPKVEEVTAPAVVEEVKNVESGKPDYKSMKFFDLKKIAADKGMEVTKATKKAAVLAFLEQ